MANDFEVTVPVRASADAAWTLAGDPARVHEWFGPVVAVTIIGDERHAVMGNGATLVERLVDRDDDARRYSYEVVSGIPGLTSHKATIRVAADGDACVVGWRQTATSDDPDYDIESRLGAVMTRGLEQMREQLEAAQ